MKQAIIILLEKHPTIEKIRKESEAFKPHITLVYEFDVADNEAVKNHISTVCSKFKPFKLTMQGLAKSERQHFLYLLIDEGKDKIFQLYEHLNKGILEGFGNPDFPDYIPHLTLGNYDNDEELELAMEECPALFYEMIVKEIHLIDIDDEKFTPFPLG